MAHFYGLNFGKPMYKLGSFNAEIDPAINQTIAPMSEQMVIQHLKHCRDLTRGFACRTFPGIWRHWCKALLELATHTKSEKDKIALVAAKILNAERTLRLANFIFDQNFSLEKIEINPAGWLVHIKKEKSILFSEMVSFAYDIGLAAKDGFQNAPDSLRTSAQEKMEAIIEEIEKSSALALKETKSSSAFEKTEQICV